MKGVYYRCGGGGVIMRASIWCMSITFWYSEGGALVEESYSLQKVGLLDFQFSSRSPCILNGMESSAFCLPRKRLQLRLTFQPQLVARCCVVVRAALQSRNCYCERCSFVGEEWSMF